MAPAKVRRRLSGGVEWQGDGTAHARAWAPACQSVDFVVEPSPDRPRVVVALDREADGHYSGLITNVNPGDRYWFRLGGDRLRPDPVSLYQPDGPHGPSQIVDPDAFAWTDQGWLGVGTQGHVLYEMHVGTFTWEGTWLAAAEQLEELAALGVTIIEMMPVADFPGRWGWGYDGVNLYAPSRLYGAPDDLRAFVDRAHALGLGVILDVVYNHFGPDGNFIADFSDDYFTDKYKNDWGRPINFEGPEPVREFFIQNAAYWIREFHFDGLRLDATQDIHDASPEHVLAAIAERCREAAGTRQLYLVAENESQDTRLVRARARDGFALDALWNDDFHHTAFVALTGRREAYFLDYKGAPQELLSCAKYGYLYQGQWYSWQEQRRGTPALDLPRRMFVTYLENHDQTANMGFGRRLHEVSSPHRFRALTALLLLGPGTPLLFQGQEFSASAPFVYFVDHQEHLQEPVRKGRREFLKQFPSLADSSIDAALPSPTDEQTFWNCKLDLTERATHGGAYALHRDLIALRRSDPVLAQAGECRLDGAILSSQAFVLRYFGESAGDRILVVNMGCDLDLSPAPEPLLAPPAGCRWTVQWSSESVEYGGRGTPPVTPDERWQLAGEAAILFRSEPRAASERKKDGDSRAGADT